MKLGQATAHFNDVVFDGYDGSAWVSNVAAGNFLTYDRFLGPRTFGHKQRMVLIGGDGAAALAYEVLRTPDGKIYLVISYNHDIRDEGTYATSILLQEAPYTADVTEYQTTTAPSGLESDAVPTTIATFHCDLERYTSEASSEFDTVRYGIMTIMLPKSAISVVGTDHELLISGRYYEIKEVEPVLGATEVRALQRGA